MTRKYMPADLPGEQYCFLQDIAKTDSRPDLVIWNDLTVHLTTVDVGSRGFISATSSTATSPTQGRRSREN